MNIDLTHLITAMRDEGVRMPLATVSRDDAEREKVNVQDLLHGDTLLFYIKRLAERKGTDDLQAAASLFQKRYASLLLAAVLSPMTRAGVALLADAAVTSIVLEEDHPAEVELGGNESLLLVEERLQKAYPDFVSEGWSSLLSEDELRDVVLQKLFDDNLAPFSLRVAEVTGLSLRILWGNIGNYCAYFFDQLRHDPVLGAQAERDEAALMTSVGYDNCPLSRTSELRYIAEATPPQWARVRSTCCLWCHLSNGSYCVTCPRLSEEQRVEKLNATD